MKADVLKRYLLAALIVPVGAFAQSPDWTYVQASYVSADLDTDGDDVEPDGYEVKGSFEINEMFFVDGAYSHVEDDIDIGFGGFDLEIDRGNIGLGLKQGLNDTTDIYGRAAWEYWEIQNFDDNGYSLGGGIRTVLNDKLEVNAEAGYIDAGDIIDGEFFFGAGAIFTFDNGIGLGASYSNIDDYSAINLTLRYAFR